MSNLYDEYYPDYLIPRKLSRRNREPYSFYNENLDKQTTRELRKEAKIMAEKLF